MRLVKKAYELCEGDVVGISSFHVVYAGVLSAVNKFEVGGITLDSPTQLYLFGVGEGHSKIACSIGFECPQDTLFELIEEGSCK